MKDMRLLNDLIETDVVGHPKGALVILRELIISLPRIFQPAESAETSELVF